MKLFFKVISLASTAALLFGNIAFVANAADAGQDNTAFRDKMQKIIALNVGKADAVISGQNKNIDDTNQSVAPFVEGGRTYVPVRFISEGLGATVNWNASEKAVDIQSDSIHIKLVVGQNNLTVNGQDTQMDAQAMVKDGRTFVPVRFIAQALGKNIYYDNGLIILSSYDLKIDGNVDKTLIEMYRNRIANPSIRGQDRGQGNFQRPDEMGEVTSVSGDQITLKMIQMPQYSRQRGQRDNSDNGTSSSNSSNSSNGDFQGQSGQGQHAIQYTGETKTITVPSNIQITSVQRSEQGFQTVNVALSDIKAGDTLSITYSDKTNGVISKISVRSQSNSR